MPGTWARFYHASRTWMLGNKEIMSNGKGKDAEMCGVCLGSIDYFNRRRDFFFFYRMVRVAGV